VMKIIWAMPRAAALTYFFALVGASWAQDSTYCRKVRERAASDASLLFAPSVQVQGLKFPSDGTVDLSVTNGSGYQFRAGLSLSPLDMYRGTRTLRVGEADCQAHELTMTLQELLLAGADFGRLPALRRELAYLDLQESAWGAILAETERRLAAGAATLVDATDVRKRVSDLSRKRAQLKGDVQRLEAMGLDQLEHRALSPALIDDAIAAGMRFEDEVSDIRELDPWTLSLTGGVVPQDAHNFFGMVQLGFNVGAFVRHAKEERYLAARAEELRAARYEAPAQFQRFRAQVQAAHDQAQRELDIVSNSLSAARAAREILAAHENAPNASHAVALTDLGLIEGEADRVYLTALVEELTRALETPHGS